MSKAIFKFCSILFLYIASFLVIPPVYALVFDNGLINDFSGVSGGGNTVRDSSSGAITTLNVLDGAVFGSVTALDSSRVNISSGATVNSRLLATDSSVVNVFGGDITFASTGGTAKLSIFDGNFDFGVRGSGSASIAITDGIFTNNGSSPNAISLLGDSKLELHGGSFTGRLFFGGGSADVYGGSFSEIRNQAGSITTIYGGDFNLPFGEITDNLPPTSLTGTLADGSPLDITISQGRTFNSKIILAPVPLPGAVVMFVSGLIGLLTVRWSRKDLA